MMKTILWPMVIGLLFLGGCAKEREKTTASTSCVQPAHHWGENCSTCHKTWNLMAIHTTTTTSYNNECLMCHGNKLCAKSLSANVPDIHVKMMKYVFHATGDRGVTNNTCQHCHKEVDFHEGSAAGIRKQVAAQGCDDCHGPKGPGKPLYIQ